MPALLVLEFAYAGTGNTSLKIDATYLSPRLQINTKLFMLNISRLSEEIKSVSVPISGGTNEELMRVRRQWEKIAQKVPVSHARCLRLIKIFALFSNPFMGLNPASVFYNEPDVIALQGIGIMGDVELKEKLAHDLGHVAYNMLPEVRKAWGKIKNHALDYRFFPAAIVATAVAGIGFVIARNFIDFATAKKIAYVFLPVLGMHIMYLLFEMRLHHKSFNRTTSYVSQYAMKDREEDFAESYRFYVLKRDEFRERAKADKILSAKYEVLEKLFGQKNQTMTNDAFETAKTAGREQKLKEAIPPLNPLSKASRAKLAPDMKMGVFDSGLFPVNKLIQTSI